MGSGKQGLVRALALAPVYALVVGVVFADPPASTAVQWGALIGVALVYGALVGSWWACVVPGGVFAAGVVVEVVEAISQSEQIPLGLVLTVGSLGAFGGISFGVMVGKGLRPRWGKATRKLG